MILTDHAIKRCQQRGIPESIVNLILEIGDSFDGGDGCEIVMACSKLTKVELRAEVRHLGLKHKKKWESAFVVVAQGDVLVTAGHRTKKIRQ